MAEYIKREAAIDTIQNIQGPILSKEVSALRKLPAADVVEVRPELRKAVELLRKEYEKAQRQSFVRDPLAYALYQTWKIVDGAKRGDLNG